MSILTDSLILCGGLALLIGGGEWLVRGGSGLARSLGVSPLVVGLTIVSFGTSAPELAVNMGAAFRGATELSFGNIVGSNIANIGLILACGALVRPMNVEGTVVRREVPIMLLVTAAALILGLDTWFDEAASINVYVRGDGLVLLLLFSMFIYNAVRDGLRQRALGGRVPNLSDGAAAGRGTAANVGLFLVGTVGLIIGADLTVDGATAVARELGVSEVMIGLTIVAFGTSLPELVATVIAARRGEAAIALGNVIGSNVFNISFVLGVTSVARPIEVPAGGSIDLLVVSVLSVIVLISCMTGGRRVGRGEGVFLLVLYIAYIAWLVLAGRSAVLSAAG